MTYAWMILSALFAAGEAAPGLEVYFIDMEGGAATLLISPNRESLLIDSGNPGVRDATRIHQVARRAGLQRIDHYLTTHWHADHYGGIGHLTELIPVEHFYDRGIPEKLAEDPQYFPFLIGNYRKVSEGKRKELKPGDHVPFTQAKGLPKLDVLCLTSARRVLQPKGDAPPNECCSGHQPRKRDASDNAMSISLLVQYGKFRFLNCGDLTWNVEYDLVCPRDPIGKVDVFQVTHHGLSSSNNPVLVRTVSPRVAIFENGPRKGATPGVVRTIRELPDLLAIYQLHRNLAVGDDLNTKAAFIANTVESPDCKGEYIRMTVARDGNSYSIQVGANGSAQTYKTRETR